MLPRETAAMKYWISSRVSARPSRFLMMMSTMRMRWGRRASAHVGDHLRGRRRRRIADEHAFAHERPRRGEPAAAAMPHLDERLPLAHFETDIDADRNAHAVIDRLADRVAAGAELVA